MLYTSENTHWLLYRCHTMYAPVSRFEPSAMHETLEAVMNVHICKTSVQPQYAVTRINGAVSSRKYHCYITSKSHYTLDLCVQINGITVGKKSDIEIIK